MPARSYNDDDALKRLNLFDFYSSTVDEALGLLLFSPPRFSLIVSVHGISRFMIAAVNHVFLLIFRST
jgi:hypothetical protein